MIVFPLTLNKTYFYQGFFNVTVDYDRHVAEEEGPITLILGTDGRIRGRIDRSANQNSTARIWAGAKLRD